MHVKEGGLCSCRGVKSLANSKTKPDGLTCESDKRTNEGRKKGRKEGRGVCEKGRGHEIRRSIRLEGGGVGGDSKQADTGGN